MLTVKHLKWGHMLLNVKSMNIVAGRYLIFFFLVSHGIPQPDRSRTIPSRY
ncbi:uncharacterized protein DS421_5g156580 [Arachis hypogaea]|nr:uncharacterized protein DS421_5g156580 [Arachis hypogaea]